ncbi:MAG TPA: sensor domain-containing diguanylate cyclase [Azospira sp.]|nr:sensor domain-containing diguanylate cyclase [Azospira sp.]
MTPGDAMGKGSEKIAVRLVAVLTALFLLCQWSFVVYWGQRAREEEMALNRVALTRLAGAVEEQTRRMFKMVEVFLGTADLWIAAHPHADPRVDPQFAALVENFRQATGGIDIRMVSSDGQLYYVGQPQAASLANVSDRDYFRAHQANQESATKATQATRGFFIAAPVISRVTGKWGIPVSISLQHPVAGISVLFAALEIDPFITLFESERIHPNGAIALVRRDGVILARAPYREEVIGRSAAQTDVFAQFLPQASRGVVLSSSSATDGVPKLTAYAALEDFPLVVVVGAAADDVLARWRRDVWVIGLASLALTLLALAAAWRLICLLQEQARTRAVLYQLASTDDLTGCLNRRHFLEILGRDFARTQRHGQPLSVMVLDLDFFKRINDGYGHAVGDQALNAFVVAARDCLRQTDVLARLGGEEFGILLPDTGAEQSLPLAERLRQAVAAIRIPTPLGEVHFTVSIGVAEYTPAATEPDTLLLWADRALYGAKAAGRNRVVIQGPPPGTASKTGVQEPA